MMMMMMGLVVHGHGTSFLQITHNICNPSPPKSQSSSHPRLLLLHSRKPTPILISSSSSRHTKGIQKKNEGRERERDFFWKRRGAILLVGLSATISLLHKRASANEGSKLNLLLDKKDGVALKGLVDTQKGQYASANSFVALLSASGIIGSGVLGALYALSLKDKKQITSSIEHLRTQLNEKEAALRSLLRTCEEKVSSEQEKAQKEIRRAKEEQLSVSKQLASATSTIASLESELHFGKRSVGDLNRQIEKFQTEIAQTEQGKLLLNSELTEKRNQVEFLNGKLNLLNMELKERISEVHNLKLCLEKKEREWKDLASASELTKAALVDAKAELEGLKDGLLRSQEEIRSDKSVITDLRKSLGLMTADRDDLRNKVSVLEKENVDFKLSSATQAARDRETLSQKDGQLQDLRAKLEECYNEVKESRSSIEILIEERSALKAKMADSETILKNLTEELHASRANLGVLRLDRENLLKELEDSQESCREHVSMISRVQAELAEAQNSFKVKLGEEKATSRNLSLELDTLKERLEENNEERESVKEELKYVKATKMNLERELIEIYKKAESVSQDLIEEKQASLLMTKELDAVRDKLMDQMEVRRSLESDLEKATASLDQMNTNAELLAKEVEIFKSRAENLESEKIFLLESLHEQKLLANEVQENAENTHNTLVRFGKEKEQLSAKARKLEADLASMKAEVLQLRRQLNAKRNAADHNHTSETITAGDDGSSPQLEKITRRRKTLGSELNVSPATGNTPIRSDV